MRPSTAAAAAVAGRSSCASGPRTPVSETVVSPEGHARGERLPRSARIRRTREIREVLSRGTRRRTRLLDLYVLDSTGGRPRVGWIVPKLGQGIVARNRLRRRLREIARRRVLAELWRSGRECDVLVRVRRKAYRAAYGRLEAEWTAGLEGLWSQS